MYFGYTVLGKRSVKVLISRSLGDSGKSETDQSSVEQNNFCPASRRRFSEFRKCPRWSHTGKKGLYVGIVLLFRGIKANAGALSPGIPASPQAALIRNDSRSALALSPPLGRLLHTLTRAIALLPVVAAFRADCSAASRTP